MDSDKFDIDFIFSKMKGEVYVVTWRSALSACGEEKNIPILCADQNRIVRILLDAGNQYAGCGFEIRVVDQGASVSVVFNKDGRPAAGFSLYTDFDFNGIRVSPEYAREVLDNRKVDQRTSGHGDYPLYMVDQIDEMAIRYLEYMAGHDERSGEAGQLKYLLKRMEEEAPRAAVADRIRRFTDCAVPGKTWPPGVRKGLDKYRFSPSPADPSEDRETGNRPHRRGTVECIVFSRDRALQLHALLSSYFEKVRHPAPVHLLYRTSSPEHQKSYEEVIHLFSRGLASAEKEKDFRWDLIRLLESIRAEKVFFLVDDDLFLEEVDMDDFAGYDLDGFVPSLRMGLNLTRCYSKDRDQPLPPLIPGLIKDDNMVCWLWDQGAYDWGYPFSVDGNLFSRMEILAMARQVQFGAPNTFEGNLHQMFCGIFKPRFGVCYRKSRIVNIPCNMVQTEYDNLHGSLHQDILLEKWNRGYQLDFRRLYGFRNNGAHQDIPLEFTRRDPFVRPDNMKAGELKYGEGPGVSN